MGQLQSLIGQDNCAKPQIEDLEILIKNTKEKLQQTKIEGKIKRDQQEEEIYSMKIVLYENRKKLLTKANHCQDAHSFSYYIDIIQSAHTPDKVANKSVQRDIPGEGVQPKSRSMVSQYFKLTFTIFAWFEAYLLKRLHMAMLQQRQMYIHSKSWSGAIADLYFEIPRLKNKFEKTLGGLFLRKQSLEIEKQQKQGTYANHVQLQMKAIMKLEKAAKAIMELEKASLKEERAISEQNMSWEEENAPSKRKSLPTLINIHSNSGEVKNCGTDTTSRSSDVYTADCSDGTTELGQQMKKIDESYHTSFYRIDDSHGFESEITDSADEEESYNGSSSDNDSNSHKQPSTTAVKALHERFVTMPQNFHWHTDATAEDRERARKEAAYENARLERERMARRSQEMRLRNWEENLLLLDEIKKAESGGGSALEITPEKRMEAERLRRLEEIKSAKDRQRMERATFKAQRLQNIQNRLHRASASSLTPPGSERSSNSRSSGILDVSHAPRSPIDSTRWTSGVHSPPETKPTTSLFGPRKHP